MSSKKIRTWLSQFGKCYFTYCKGFYHFPCDVTSPEKLVNSFNGLPFATHSVDRQCVTITTPILEDRFHYQKLEDGCWIFYSRVNYKANLAFDLAYEDSGDSGYYMLVLNNVNNSARTYTSMFDGHVCFPKYGWALFKPRVRPRSVNFKNDDSRYIALLFNEAWRRKNLVPSRLFEECGLDRFFQSEEEHILWPISEQDAKWETFSHFEKIMNIDTEVRRVDLLQLKSSALNLIFDFLRLCAEQNVVDAHRAIEYTERFSLDRMEHYLRNHLCEKFPGIDFLAEKFGVPPTRLKNQFKQMFGKPVFQYFQAQQMILARKLIDEKKLLVKEISHRFGYESPGKFSAAFKRHHGVLPSELKA
jgi:AraC-like DNA-binding protein